MVDHRPWPAPACPHTMTQVWHDLLFAHWPIDVAVVRALIPSPLSVDRYAGSAWLGVVPFRMSGIRPRSSFAWPWLSAFPELNVRTYVSLDDKPGVWFFSLDAANPVAVALARRWYHLPYFRARMSLREDAQTIHYSSHRTHWNATAADLVAVYRPAGEVFRAEPGSLEHWLTERYCLYSVDPRGQIYRAEIHHPPWPLQPAEAYFTLNTMAAAHGITLPDIPPRLHFARRQDVLVWSPRRLPDVML